jgi:hypothetical protein
MSLAQINIRDVTQDSSSASASGTVLSDSTPRSVSDPEQRSVLTVYIRVKVQVDLQVDKSSVVVKGPFFPRVMNPRYRIRGINV